MLIECEPSTSSPSLILEDWTFRRLFGRRTLISRLKKESMIVQEPCTRSSWIKQITLKSGSVLRSLKSIFRRKRKKKRRRMKTALTKKLQNDRFQRPPKYAEGPYWNGDIDV